LKHSVVICFCTIALIVSEMTYYVSSRTLNSYLLTYTSIKQDTIKNGFVLKLSIEFNDEGKLMQNKMSLLSLNSIYLHAGYMLSEAGTIYLLSCMSVHAKTEKKTINQELM